VVGLSPEVSRAQLERVLRCPGLKNSDGLRALLAYLGEKALTAPGEELKEYTVGVEACGKPSSYDPQRDASVRVQAGRLRKRLEEYYAVDGVADDIVIDVPKGRFAVVFQRRGESATRPAFRWELVRSGRFWLGVALAAAVLSFVWVAVLQQRIRDLDARFGISRQQAMAHEFAPVWGGFLTSDNPALVVFGSPEVASGGSHEYAAMGETLAVQRLTSFFASAGVPMRAQPAHLANWESASAGNLILLGAWHMNSLMRGLPVRQDFAFGDDGMVFNRNPQAGEPLAYTRPAGVAFAIAATYEGLKPGRSILVVMTEHPAAPLGAVDFLTDPRSAALLMEKLKANPGHGHFQMLLRVYLDRDSAVKTEYVTHHTD
jgi:hypothetical protein